MATATTIISPTLTPSVQYDDAKAAMRRSASASYPVCALEVANRAVSGAGRAG